MGRTVNAELYREFYEDNAWWEKRFGAPDAVYVEDDVDLYDDDGKWIATGKLDVGDLGWVIDVSGERPGTRYVCQTIEIFDEWLAEFDKVDWIFLKVKVRRDQAENVKMLLGKIDGVVEVL
jgi:hypothetical protein